MQHDFILIDRSGSMQGQWDEAIKAVNAYTQKLAEDNVDTGVTIAAFDGQGGLDFQILRDRITPKTLKALDVKETQPRGMTPLNDAVGKIVALAKGGNYDKVAIIIMTDGHENASRELSVQQAKDLLDECRAKNWQVIFLGANYDNAAQATSYGNAMRSTASAASGNFVAAMAMTATKRSAWAEGASADMSYTDAEKTKLKERKAKA